MAQHLANKPLFLVGLAPLPWLWAPPSIFLVIDLLATAILFILFFQYIKNAKPLTPGQYTDLLESNEEVRDRLYTLEERQIRAERRMEANRAAAVQEHQTELREFRKQTRLIEELMARVSGMTRAVEQIPCVQDAACPADHEVAR